MLENINNIINVSSSNDSLYVLKNIKGTRDKVPLIPQDILDYIISSIFVRSDTNVLRSTREQYDLMAKNNKVNGSMSLNEKPKPSIEPKQKSIEPKQRNIESKQRNIEPKQKSIEQKRRQQTVEQTTNAIVNNPILRFIGRVATHHFWHEFWRLIFRR